MANQRTTHRLGLSRAGWRWLAGWTGLGAVLNLFYVQLVDEFFIFILPVYAAHGVAGLLTLLIWLGRLLASHRESPAPALVMLMAWVGLLLATPHLSHGGALLKFLAAKPAYDRIVTHAWSGAYLDDPVPRRGAEAGYQFTIDYGPPVRVGFIWGKLADNWNGVVWDPTGIVKTARGWRERDGRGHLTASAEAQKLFGGDLIRCRRLIDHYYRCGFT